MAAPTIRNQSLKTKATTSTLVGVSRCGLHSSHTARLKAGAKLPGLWAEAPYTRPADLTTCFIGFLAFNERPSTLTMNATGRDPCGGSLSQPRQALSSTPSRAVRQQSCCCQQTAYLGKASGCSGCNDCLLISGQRQGQVNGTARSKARPDQRRRQIKGMSSVEVRLHG